MCVPRRSESVKTGGCHLNRLLRSHLEGAAWEREPQRPGDLRPASATRTFTPEEFTLGCAVPAGLSISQTGLRARSRAEPGEPEGAHHTAALL